MNEDRRRLLKGLGAVAGLTLGAGYVSLAPKGWRLSLSDPDGERGKPRPKGLRLPEKGFAVEPSTVLPHLGVARGADVDAMLKAAVDAIGGIRRFVTTGDVVLVKPNVAFERSAPLGATSSPDVVAALDVQDTPEHVLLRVHPMGDAELEVWDALRHLGPLERALGAPVRLEVVRTGAAPGPRATGPGARRAGARRKTVTGPTPQAA